MLFEDYFRPSDFSSWETPLHKPSKDLLSGSMTLAVGLLETRAGSKILKVFGDALTGSADDITTALRDKFDKVKIAEEKNKLDAAIDAARSKATTDTIDAITKWGTAKSAYDACAAISDGAPQKSALAITFAAERLRAIEAIAKAEPLAAGVKLDRTFLDSPISCQL